MNRRVAIVTPWYGDDSAGGAEMLAREMAGRLAQHAAVTVLTTTSRSFLHSWDADFYRPGVTREHGYDVARFPVRPRSTEAFAAINEMLLGLPEERWPWLSRTATLLDPFVEESINAPGLERHLRHDAAKLYDAVVALPYLYGVVVRGIEAARVPVHLIPCLHDEPYARLPRIESAIHKAKTLLFNSAGEAELALRLYGPGVLPKSHVIGAGIPRVESGAAPSPVSGRYYLYLGRRVSEKGVDQLIQLFRDYRSNGSQSTAKLVLAGPGERSYDDAGSGIHDLGFIDEATKTTLLRNALALLNPSRNESYSRVLMEAWREEIPVIVNADCLATATAVEESGGGLLASSHDEWLSALRMVEEMESTERRRIGGFGANYAAENADWEKVIERLRAAIGIADAGGVKRTGKRIDQLLEAFDRGDAISDDARGIAAELRARGYDTNIYAANLAPGVTDAGPLPALLDRADGLIYHHSIGSDIAERYIGANARKAVIYHNVTPAEFFAPYAPEVARQLQRGREQLRGVVEASDICVGDSPFNSAEMTALGARNVRTIPVATEFRRFDVTPNPAVLDAKRGTTWLFVGRVSPNKGIGPLIDAFEAYLALDEDSALVILGKYDKAQRYYAELRATLAQRRIDPYVYFTNYVEDASVVAHYRNADVFVSLSEHEGFCVPLVEAMFFDVPIVAKAAAAVPDTLGMGGLLLEGSASAYEVAAAVYEVCNDRGLRAQIISAQRERRRAFMPFHVNALIGELAKDLVD